MANGYQGFALADDSGAHAKGTGTLHAVRLLAQGWPASATAEALDRDPHTIGRCAAAFGEGGPAALMIEHFGGPPVLCGAQQTELREAVQELPETAGIGLANWTLRQAQEEGRADFRVGALWHQPEQLPELPLVCTGTGSAPVGICPETSQEAVGQGE